MTTMTKKTERYTRIVAAAVAEVGSKFRLAEALAQDIPPKRRGPTADDEESVSLHLAAARERIIAAGGEPKSVITLNEYRKTALWVSIGTDRNFGWIEGYSFSAHVEARQTGVAYADFAAHPTNVDETRRAAGRAGTDGPPAKTIAGWTPEQKAEAARALIADYVVQSDPGVRTQIVEAAASDPALTAQTIVRAEERSEQRRTATQIERGSMVEETDLLVLLGVCGEIEGAVKRRQPDLERVVAAIRRGAFVEADREALAYGVQRLMRTAEMLRRSAAEVDLALQTM